MLQLAVMVSTGFLGYKIMQVINYFVCALLQKILTLGN